MPVICAWCGRVLEPGDPSLPASHGICPACQRDVLKGEGLEGMMTTKARHTPEPWQYTLLSNPMLVIALLADGAQVVAHISGRTLEEAIANARLIAKAPDMRTVMGELLASVEAWQEQYDPDRTDTVTEASRQKTRTLLAEIDGEP